MQKFALEKSKFFSYVAWSTIIGFSLFVYSLVINLQATAADLRQTTENLELMIQQTNTPPATSTKPR